MARSGTTFFTLPKLRFWWWSAQRCNWAHYLFKKIRKLEKINKFKVRETAIIRKIPNIVILKIVARVRIDGFIRSIIKW